jgi:hypothetical protein
MRIDPYEGQERLSPLVTIENEDLLDVLQALHLAAPIRFNKAVVGPLRSLTLAMRQRHRMNRNALNNESHEQIHLLRRFGHPHFLAGLVEWVHARDHVSADQAESALRQWTGLALRVGPNGWEGWWEKAKPLIEVEHVLSTPSGRKKWSRAYLSADKATRAVLLGWWGFEPAVDETAMVREAADEDGEALKAALALYWKHGRLSGKAKASLVQKFIEVRLEEVTDQPASARRELRIVGKRNFPFPAEAWINWRASIVIGDKKPSLDASFNTSSLGQETASLVLGSMGGGSYPGSPKARAILEVREVDYPRDRQVIWNHEWKLGPIRLREAKE